MRTLTRVACAALLAPFALLIACSRGESDETAAVRVDIPRSPPAALTEHTSWDGPATPIGWATVAERRAAEEAFARGDDETTEPSAIGGGPQDEVD